MEQKGRLGMDFVTKEDSICLEDASGAVIAGVFFLPRSENIVEITSTQVDSSLRGQGVADRLLTALAEKLRADGLKAIPTCSYAVKWFLNHPEYADITHPQL